jgi:replication-associated recombination protein RarA
MTDIYDALSKTISSFSLPNCEDASVRDRDILSSSLQKSLRRADLSCAMSAAKGLITFDPNYLWRRLVAITFEDFGLSNLSLTAAIVAAARNRAWRQSVGGDLQVAAHFIQQLALKH